MNDSKSMDLITHDLLEGSGGCDHDSLNELDLDLHVPVDFKKRLDLKVNYIYFTCFKIHTYIYSTSSFS